MGENHKASSESESVEKNLSKDYVPKSKPGALPVSNQLGDVLKEKQKKINKDIEEFKEAINKKFKFAEALGIIPSQASKKIEEEYSVSEEDSKRDLIHLLMVIPEKQFKNIGKIRLEIIELSKKINDKFWVHVMTPIDIWNLGLDSKFDIMEALAMSYPIFDKGLLSSLRVSQIHKSLVLKKFEKYVTSYVVGGSLVRGETVKTSDIDVFIIIDDTDVKRMSRLELKEKLRGIIQSYIAEAEAMAGVKNKLSPQIYLMTDFWEAVKDAHPVMFTFIRDGIPLYDRGAFLPWKSLLRMGKIKPSPEAIDMFMSSGNKLKTTIEKRIFDVATMDLFWGISTPTQGLLMLYGQAPGNVYDTVKAFRETFVNKEKLIEEKYADILDEIMIKVWKAYEHGKLKPGDIDGKELDRLSKDALDYIDRIKKLREQIEKRIQEKSIGKTYDDTFGMVGALLKKNSEDSILKSFDEELVKKGKFPQRFLKNLKFISKVRNEIEKSRNNSKTEGKSKSNGVDKKKNMDKSKKSVLTSKQSRDVDDARKFSSEIIDALIEYTQRCEFASMERSKFLLKGRDSDSEVFFLRNLFLVNGSKIQKLLGEKLVKSDSEELKKQLLEHKDKDGKIDFKSLEVLKKIFGDFELVY